MSKSLKKNIVILLTIILSLSIALTILSLLLSKGDKYILQRVSGVDTSNKSNISTWQEVPIVNQEMLDKGYLGGEGGQWPLCIGGDNQDSQLIFYGTDVGGIFKSVDGGNTFSKKNVGLFSNGICDIVVDPNNKNNVVCFGVNGGNVSYTTGIYYSNDQGETWNFGQHFPIYGHRNTIEDLAYDETSYDESIKGSKILYLSLIEKFDYRETLLTDTNKGLYKSLDGGKTWSQINKNLGDCIVKVDSLGRVFCGNYSGLYVSEDKGESFKKILEDNVTGLDVAKNTAYILVNNQTAENGKKTYAKIYSYKDNLTLINNLVGGDEADPNGGNTHLISENWQWHYVKGGSDDKCLYHFNTDVHKVYNLKVSPVNTNNMVLVMTNRLYWENASNTVLYSNDGGNSFNISLPNKLKTGDKQDYHILPYSNRRMNFYFSRADENVIFDFENDWLSKSTDGGKSFYYNSNGINGIMCGGKFYFNQFDADLMYFGSQDYCGAFTKDGGKTWKFVNLTKDNPLNDGANVYGGYAASENVLFGVFAPRNSRDRYLTISYDGGETANFVLDDNHKISEGYVNSNGISRMIEQASYSSYQSPINKNILFCANLRSLDLGATWEPMSGVTGVYASHRKTGQLFGINDTLGQVVTSVDNGKTWSVVCNSTDLKKWWNNAYISDLAYDETNNIIYVTCQYGALFKIFLNENNRTQEITNNIPSSFSDKTMKDKLGSDTFFDHRLTTVCIDPNNTNIVYVGGTNYKYRAESSLFRSCDGGQTFYTIMANNSNSIVSGVQGGAEPLCIRVNKKTGDLWCAGNCLGFSKLSAPYETKQTEAKHKYKIEINDLTTNKKYYYYVYENRKIVVDQLFDGNIKLYLDKTCKVIFDETINCDMTLYIKSNGHTT